MPTSLNKYLDPTALDETVVNIRELIEGLEEEMQDLPYARPDGIYPDMTVGAVIGADETAQWATRESTGSGAATVRSVQGATEVQNGALVPVCIAGIASTDAQGGELDAIEWTAQTLWGAGAIGDLLYSDHKETRVGVVDLGTLNWTTYNTSVQGSYRLRAPLPTVIDIPSSAQLGNLTCARYQTLTGSQVYTNNTGIALSAGQELAVFDPNYNQQDSAAAFKAAMQGVMCTYELATPTTQPISPALPMTYRVEQGGSESIIVPDGEISAAPVLTVAEPVNAGDEFARIWAAIESLGYTRNVAQLSRPISLTDVGSIDEVQKDTTDVAEIETIKEVTE